MLSCIIHGCSFNKVIDELIYSIIIQISPFGLNVSTSLCEQQSISFSERGRRIVYSGSGSLFESVLDKDISVPINFKNMQFLAKETFKISKTLPISIMDAI